MRKIAIIEFKVNKFKKYFIKNKVNKITKQLKYKDTKKV